MQGRIGRRECDCALDALDSLLQPSCAHEGLSAFQFGMEHCLGPRSSKLRQPSKGVAHGQTVGARPCEVAVSGVIHSGLYILTTREAQTVCEIVDEEVIAHRATGGQGGS